MMLFRVHLEIVAHDGDVALEFSRRFTISRLGEQYAQLVDDFCFDAQASWDDDARRRVRSDDHPARNR